MDKDSLLENSLPRSRDSTLGSRDGYVPAIQGGGMDSNQRGREGEREREGGRETRKNIASGAGPARHLCLPDVSNVMDNNGTCTK